MRTEYSTRVDDRRLPFGHKHRASGLFVEAKVKWQDGVAYATMTQTSGMSEDPVLYSDLNQALMDIEDRATHDVHEIAYHIAGDIFGDTVGTLVERLKAAIAWQNQGTDGDLTEQDRQQLRELLAAVQ